MKKFLWLFPAALLFSCGAYDDSTMTPNNLPASIILGDTTAFITVTKNFRNAQGRMQTDNPYIDFYLTSSDTTKARIVQGRRVWGVGTGQALITAKDNASTLSSAAYVLQVN